MEKITQKSLLQHLATSNLFLKKDDQHGFRGGRSCATQLLEVLEDWTKALDQGLSFDCIYYRDYHKVFDSIPY